MRILVGTLYAIENELEECMKGIKEQSYQNFEHFIIEGLPKQEAHDQLYGTFMGKAADFDLFMKVDADMVIENRALFAQIVEKFQNNPQMDRLTIEVYDFFTDRQIDGLHTFRSHVRWGKRTSMVFTDRHKLPRERCVYDATELAPAATHCKNPSPFQSFHFGLHRAIKIQSYLNYPEPLDTNLQFHLDNRELLWQHFLRTGDLRLGYAALGTELTLRGDYSVEHIPYTNPYAEKRFECHYSRWQVTRLKWIVRFLRLRNRFFVPSILMYQLRKKHLRTNYRKSITKPIRLLLNFRLFQ